MEALTRAMEAHPGALEVHPGARSSPWRLELTLESRRLTLQLLWLTYEEWRLIFGGLEAHT